MSDTPPGPGSGGLPDANGRPDRPPLEIDEDGNVKGIVLSLHVDHFVEFVDQAVIPPGRRADRGTGR